MMTAERLCVCGHDLTEHAFRQPGRCHAEEQPAWLRRRDREGNSWISCPCPSFEGAR